ncbi:MAG: hypothetical protein WBG46_09805 [Nonlabens sp.]
MDSLEDKNELEYKIPFDLDLLIKQTEITLPFVFSKAFAKRREIFICSGIFLVLGISILLAGDEIGIVFILFSFIAGFNLLPRVNEYQKLKNNYMSQFTAYIENQYQIPEYGIFEFNEDALIISTNFTRSETNWKTFKDYKIVKSNLLLIRNAEQGDILAIAASEIGEKELEKVIAFVKNKIR